MENGDRFVIGSVSAFVRDSALSRAHEMLADRRTFLLGQAKWVDFHTALDAPSRRIPRYAPSLDRAGIL